MQLFSSFVLDRIGITLQMIDVFMQTIVFLLELLHLLLQHLCFFPLVRECSQPVMTEDHAVRHDERQECGREGGRATAPEIDAVLSSSGDLGQFDG